jgi:hypothetical protein
MHALQTPLLLLDVLLLASVPIGTALWVVFADVLMILFGLWGAITSHHYRSGAMTHDNSRKQNRAAMCCCIQCKVTSYKFYASEAFSSVFKLNFNLLKDKDRSEKA